MQRRRKFLAKVAIIAAIGATIVPASAAFAAEPKINSACSKVGSKTATKNFNGFLFCTKSGTKKVWRLGLTRLDYALTFCTWDISVYPWVPYRQGTKYEMARQSLIFEGVTLPDYPPAQAPQCILGQIYANPSLWSRISQTRAIDGQLSQNFKFQGDTYSVYWNYYPDTGLNISIDGSTKNSHVYEPKKVWLDKINTFK